MRNALSVSRISGDFVGYVKMLSKMEKSIIMMRIIMMEIMVASVLNKTIRFEKISCLT